LKITVIGCGYVGLVTGACLAEIGHTVVCTDNDVSKIDTLNHGGIPIYELHLDDVVARNRQNGRLSFTADLSAAVRAGDAIFICVGTPPLETGDADLTAINRVAQLIAAEAQGPKLVIEKSTVPVQTGQQLKRALAVYSRNRGLQFQVASNPEFLREGTAVLDFMHPNRVVIGVEDSGAEQQLQEIYRPLLERKFKCPVHAGNCPPEAAPVFVVTTINSAELIKHASNSFLALKISYANLLADMCERTDANVEEVTNAVGLDPRIGRDFLRPGLGFGGFCLPKDIQAFITLGKRAGVDVGILQAAEAVNKHRIDHFLEQIRSALWVMKEKPVGVLGLSFKANTDDIRFSPALDLVKRLLAEGAEVKAYDPEAMEKVEPVLPAVHLAKDEYAAAEGAEALIIATEWAQFRALDWEKIFRTMMRPLVFDTRNLLDPERMRALGFEYYSVGRPQPPAKGLGAS
jgi:UDPglucose 6-dehydrogenase